VCVYRVMAEPVEIVDAHMHLWSPHTHPWLENFKEGGHPAGKFESVTTYLLEDYLKDVEGYNVTHLVHVEAAWPGDCVGETTWLDGIASNNPRGIPQAIVGRCDLSSPRVEDTLSRHCRSGRFRGIRQMLNYHPTKPVYSEAPHDDYLTDPQWLKGVALLEKYGLSFEMHVLPHQMHRAAEVTRQFPGVKFMVNHCGLPYERDPDTMKIWRGGLADLARQPNVHCKVSGVFATDPHWTQESVAEVVQPVLDLFGLDRCVFSSNFPVDRVNGRFPQLTTALTQIFRPYSEEQRHKFFSGNAKLFYRL
jgi:predicted TIM-barrel fold metal-dependent hydrolase